MKILHVIEAMGPGGAEKLLDESLPLIANRPGYKVDLILLNKNSIDFLDNIIDSKVNVIYSPHENSRSIKNIKFIKDTINKNNYDVVHAHLFPSLYFVSIVSFLDRTDRKYFVTEHSTHNRRRTKKFLRPIEKFIYSNYDKIITITEGAQKNLMEWLEKKEKDLEKFPVVYNGINLQKFHKANKYSVNKLLSLSNQINVKTLCMVGSFSAQKDQRTIIKSLPNLSSNIHLILVGDGPRKKELQELSNNLKVEDRVHFLGIRNDVPEIYRTVDIGIVSSNWEGFGLVAVEAMAAFKPVIASNVDGLREVVDNAGLLFEKGNEKELSILINDLLENEKLYEEVQNKCFERSKQYDIENMIENQIRIYEM